MSAHDHSRSTRLAGVVVALAFAVGTALASQTAQAARTTALNESGHLRATSKHGFTLNERGSVAGTVTGTIYVHLTVVSTSRVSAEVSMYPSGGSISGYASASYTKGNQTGSFSGTLTVTRGSGRYAGAHGSGLSFSGTIRRSDDAVTVRVSGTVTE